MSIKAIGTAAALALAAWGSSSGPAEAQAEGKFRRSARPVAGEYIVVLEDTVGDVTGAALQLAASHGGQVEHVYVRALKGFSVRLPEAAAVALSRNPRVALVEENGAVETFQVPALSWGQDRSDQRNRPLNSAYTTLGGNGGGVKVYVIDTGVRSTHQEFWILPGMPISRVVSGFTSIADGRGSEDCQGHGTHVAGTVAGLTKGLAPGATIVPVRVLNCNGSGTTSGVIAGINFAIGDHVAGAAAVANMSLGGPFSSTMNVAVNNLIKDGVATVVAAGNENQDACNVSPASTPGAITVGATKGDAPTAADRRASFSNWGACVDTFAPGQGIWSAYHVEDAPADDWYAKLNGTSMASPHVAGAAALYLQGNPTSPPAATALALIRSATTGKVSDLMGSPNRLLYSRLSQQLTNPAFESGPASGWTTTAPAAVITNDSTRAHAGSFYARLGARGLAAETTQIHQNVLIPADATTANFSFYYRVRSDERTTTAKPDKLYVEIQDPSTGAVFKRLTLLSNLNESTKYKVKAYNVMEYAGQTVRFAFRTTENDGRPTTFEVDSVGLVVGR